MFAEVLLNRIHRLRLISRIGLLLLTVFFVCYPYPWIFIRHIEHTIEPDRMIKPDSAALIPLLEELSPQIDGVTDPTELLKVVQKFVYTKIEYAFDWETWGVVDYLPTVEEVVVAGREDCDGRAVLAVSLLRNLGVDAQLVSDGVHTWVWTRNGETMSPNAVGTVRSSKDGFVFDWKGLKILPRGMAYGLAVFPLLRELIIVFVAGLLMYRPGVSFRRVILSTILLLIGLGLLRYGGAGWRNPVVWALWCGLALIVAAVLVGFLRKSNRTTVGDNVDETKLAA